MDKLYNFERFKYNHLIDQCLDNKKKQKRYIRLVYMPGILVCILMVFVLAADYFFLNIGKSYSICNHRVSALELGIMLSVLGVIYFVVMFSCAKNRYDYLRKLEALPLKEKIDKMHEICDSFNIKILSEESVNNKITEIKNAMSFFKTYRNKNITFIKILFTSMAGLVITIIAKSAEISRDRRNAIIILLVLTFIFIVAFVLYLCSSNGFEFFNFTFGNMFIPYMNLLDYSLVYLYFIKQEIEKLQQEFDNDIRDNTLKSIFNKYIKSANIKQRKENKDPELYLRLKTVALTFDYLISECNFEIDQNTVDKYFDIVKNKFN